MLSAFLKRGFGDIKGVFWRERKENKIEKEEGEEELKTKTFLEVGTDSCKAKRERAGLLKSVSPCSQLILLFYMGLKSEIEA